MVVSGLRLIKSAFARSIRHEFITLTDPHIYSAFQEVFTEGQWNDFIGWSKSFYTQEEHIKSILNYDKPILEEPTDDAWIRVKEESRRVFSTYSKVKAKSVSELQTVSFHEGTSAGFGYNENPHPFPGRKGTRDQPNFRRALNIARSIGHNCMNRYAAGDFKAFIQEAIAESTPDIAFTRTQLAELPNTKVRNVFGEAFHYILLEGLFAEPLLDWFMESDTFYYIGEDPVLDVPTLLSKAAHDDATYLSIDWSSFDASTQPYEIEFAFDLLKSMLDFPNKESELVFEYVRALFIERKILSPDGRLFMRYGGVPSGSYFTHMIDSIINWNRIRYLLAKNGISHDMIRTHGDDGFVSITSLVEQFHHVIEDAAERRWFLNPDKCKLTRNISEIEFLGRYTLFGANMRNRLKCLRLCLYPEYPVTDPQISIARLKAIYVDAGGNIPEIPKAIEVLVSQHGDQELELPREFKRFNLALHTRNEGI